MARMQRGAGQAATAKAKTPHMIREIFRKPCVLEIVELGLQS